MLVWGYSGYCCLKGCYEVVTGELPCKSGFCSGRGVFSVHLIFLVLFSLFSIIYFILSFFFIFLILRLRSHVHSYYFFYIFFILFLFFIILSLSISSFLILTFTTFSFSLSYFSHSCLIFLIVSRFQYFPILSLILSGHFPSFIFSYPHSHPLSFLSFLCVFSLSLELLQFLPCYFFKHCFCVFTASKIPS